MRTLPEFKEISQFFTAELTAQLADARSTTTSKLDAPVNKLARLLNSPSIKRVLLNESLRVDFDRVIAGGEVLVVRGALGAMGAGNTSVLMQLLVGMLDASLARQQDLVPAHERVAVALKIDEAPMILNRGFAETMALKRSAGLETVACWQTDAQWVDRDVREQLDALFAHRVYFATASAGDARSAVALTMAEFSDTVRPGVGRLSSLGHPDLRLHLPKYRAIASWSTEEGRQPAFIAETIPMRVDRERLALHAARQRERGARHLSDLRQPHWDRPRSLAPSRPSAHLEPAPAPVTHAPPLAGELPEGPTGLSAEATGDSPKHTTPETPSDSYAELVELDRAQSVRATRPVKVAAAFEPDALDLEMLALVAALGHVLTSQIHRHFNPGRASSTTQRRLKKLADAALIERFQFHRRDGGGVPMCCAIGDAGIAALESRSMLPSPLAAGRGESGATLVADRGGEAGRRLAAARHDVHLGGWMLAVAHLCGRNTVTLRGSARSVLAPPSPDTAGARRGLRLTDLRLPGGRTPHDFLRTNQAGQRVELERFETIRPDGSLTLRRLSEDAAYPGVAAEEGAGPASDGAARDMSPPAIDLLIERDDRLPVGAAAAKLERYDHFLAGWAGLTTRYGRRRQAEPLVVFLCRDRRRARECARSADAALVACRAYAGEYPFDWEYPGRARIVFVAERDAHEGDLRAYGVPSLPPEVRVAAAHGDPTVGERSLEPRSALRSVVAQAGSGG